MFELPCDLVPVAAGGAKALDEPLPTLTTGHGLHPPRSPQHEPGDRSDTRDDDQPGEVETEQDQWPSEYQDDAQSDEHHDADDEAGDAEIEVDRKFERLEPAFGSVVAESLLDAAALAMG